MTTDAKSSSAGEESLPDTLHAAGLKVTTQRLAVMRALDEFPHADADELFARARTELPGTSLQAVYGVLTALAGAGLVRRIEPAGGPARFERRVGDNHHHAVCIRCSAVHDVDCVVGEAPCLVPSDTGGFAVHSAEVTFWGLCAPCQDALAETPS
jgi:Fe2+ or Zn2+ uptake regulation protein